MALICIVSSWNNSLWLLLLACVGRGWPSRGVGATSLSCWGPALRLVSDNNVRFVNVAPQTCEQ